MKSSSQRFDTEKLPWGLPAVIVVWVIWLVLAHLSRAVLDVYTAISPLRYLGAANVPNLRNLIFAPGMLVAIALLVPVLIAAGIAFRIVAARYRGAPMEALAFTRQNHVWVLAVVVLLRCLADVSPADRPRLVQLPAAVSRTQRWLPLASRSGAVRRERAGDGSFGGNTSVWILLSHPGGRLGQMGGRASLRRMLCPATTCYAGRLLATGGGLAGNGHLPDSSTDADRISLYRYAWLYWLFDLHRPIGSVGRTSHRLELPVGLRRSMLTASSTAALRAQTPTRTACIAGRAGERGSVPLPPCWRLAG